MNKKLLAAIVVVIIIVGSIGSWFIYSLSQGGTSIPPLSLTVVGAEGNEVVLDEKDLADLTSVASKGGYKTSGGLIAATGSYTGVSVITLADLVGGMPSDATLTVTASDGYSMVFTHAQANGEDFTTYDPVTGSEKAATQPLTLIVYYFCNGTAIPSGAGPLRMAIVGSEGLLTEGHFWVKMISKVEVTADVRDWSVQVDATSTLHMDRQAYTADLIHFGVNYTDGSGDVWLGSALWRWVSWSNYNGGVSNASLDAGYSVKIISGDGYSATIDDSRVKNNDNILVAAKLNGAVLPDPYWPLTLVGSAVSSQEKVKNIVQIQILLDNPSASPSPSPSPSPTATPTASPSPSPSLPSLTLTLVAANGTQITLSSSDMAALTAYSANGGTKSDTGKLSNYGLYTGVPILALCNMVGGVTSSNTVLVTASDSYTSTYTYQQLNGQGITTYDSTGNAVPPTQPLTVIVAYYLNSTSLPSGAGPLRIIAVGPDGYYTSGNLSAKMVVKIEIL